MAEREKERCKRNVREKMENHVRYTYTDRVIRSKEKKKNCEKEKGKRRELKEKS